MKQLCGIFDFRESQYSDKSKEIYKYVNEKFEIYVYGKIRLNQNDIDGELLWKYYQKYGEKITEQIQGIYILIIYDKKNKKLHVFQDRTTSPLTLYYTVNNDKVYLGTSLKWILKESRIERVFNDNVLEEFLINGYIYGKETLIKNVYKVKAFSCLLIEKNKIQEVHVNYSINKLTKGEALDLWESALSDAIGHCISGKNEINIPLSSGYDSNYIAYVADKEGNKKINAYSVGGKFGKNELPVVKENISVYNNMQLYTSLTDEFTLSNLPDIVWRLEGAVYEVGIFLQYELSKLVSQNGKTSLICGECADQVMNQYYLDEDRIFVSQKEGCPTYYEFSEYPYIFGSYLILKKNGILSNSFGIETEYPFLDDNFVSIANSLKYINKKDKRIHVAICQEKLPDTIVKNISKIGGATDFHSLFANKEAQDKFMLNIENSEFYQKYAPRIKCMSYIEKEKQSGLKKLKTNIRNRVLDICKLNVEQREQTAYFLDEIKLKEYMCCAYLMLFDKLFISGKYDNRLDFSAININISDLIG